jgi:hypothetical protein
MMVLSAMSALGVIDTESKRMELFDVHLSKFPVYSFRLAEDSSSLRIANVTDKLLFVLTKGSATISFL